MIFLYLILIVIVLIYVYFTWNFDYWHKRGVPAPKAIPFLGNFPNGLRQKQNIIFDVQKIYNEFKGKSPFVGVIETRMPSLLLIEPELVKDVLIRKFKSFHDNEFSNLIDPKLDPLFARNPFFLKGEEWKDKRAEITPAFTNHRINSLFPIIQDVIEKMIVYLNRETKKGDPFDARELAAKFTTDVVSNAIYGTDAESFTKEKPEIRERGRQIFSFTTFDFFKVTLARSVPFLQKYLKIRFSKAEVQDFFKDLMTQAVNYRKENNVQREDFLDYVIHLREKKHISDLDMASHSISFFSDGFETSSIAISGALYELAKNKRVQEKLREEIKKNCDESGKITFDAIHEMDYLDQVFYEGLRMHGPLMMNTRMCNEDTLMSYEGSSVTVEKGIQVIIPIHCLHFDPEYYLEPNQFYPERFDDGSVKTYRDRGVLLPFGDGPRICLGMRFALLQSKAALAAIVQNFDLSVNEKTLDPLTIDPKEFMNIKLGGIWINIKPISV